MKNFSLGFIALTLAASANAQEKPQDKMQTPQVFSKIVTNKIELNFLMFLPDGYKSDVKKKWPLILFLHGAGERGTDVWKATTHGPAKYIAAHPDFPFILVTPLCPTNEVWSTDKLLALLDDVIKKNRVDEKRVYLTGLSMGGFGTWNLATAFPEKFAAVAPICGGGDIINVLLASHGYGGPEKVNALKTLPVWAFHGGKDSVVPHEESERMIAELKKAKVAEVKYTLYPEAQHDSWSETYNNPELYEWFLAHIR